MSPTLKIRAVGALALATLLASTSGAFADNRPSCEAIAKDVRASIAKEPKKVLMIVEDALVINEGCACEIVKAAIQVTNADAALKKQIVETAVAVAPKMSPVIMECAGMSSESEGHTEVVAKATGKDAKNVQPEVVTPPKESGSDYSSSGFSDIRGLYLMQPSLSGPVVTTTNRHHRKPHTQPLSPSQACVP